ncbi:MAG: hypothetical protein ACRC7O_09170 [Fimbriiglobus sp.]
MAQLIADATLPVQIGRATEAVEVVTTEGVTLGVYTPMRHPRSPYPREEIERRRQESRANPGAGKALDEILARLRADHGDER